MQFILDDRLREIEGGTDLETILRNGSKTIYNPGPKPNTA